MTRVRPCNFPSLLRDAAMVELQLELLEIGIEILPLP
jgi:hypothetical protein